MRGRTGICCRRDSTVAVGSAGGNIVGETVFGGSDRLIRARTTGGVSRITDVDVGSLGTLDVLRDSGAIGRVSRGL